MGISPLTFHEIEWTAKLEEKKIFFIKSIPEECISELNFYYIYSWKNRNTY